MDAILRRRRWLAPSAVALLAIVPYLNTLSAELVLDDVFIIKENRQIRSLTSIPGLFVSHYWSGTSWIADRGLYRPLAMATYAVNYALHGDWPAGYHAANVLLHAAASLLLLALVRRLFDDDVLAFIAAAWFAVHPIHTEAVAGIVGRAEIIAALGVFGCIYAYDRARVAAQGSSMRRVVGLWIALALFSYAAACFSKETGIVAPVLIVVLEWLRPQQRWVLRGRCAALTLLGGCVLVAGTYLLMRSSVVVEATLPHPGWRVVAADGRVSAVTHDVRIYTALRVALEYVGLMVWPAPLTADYWTTDVPLARSPVARGTLAAAFVLACAIIVAVKCWRRHAAIAFGLLSFGIALFPVSNLAIPIGVMKAERLMYTPSAWLLLAAAGGIAVALRRPVWTKPVWIGVAAITLTFGVRTIDRNFDWRSNRALAEATLEVSPNSPMMNTNLGLWHRDDGDLVKARYYVERSSAAEPLNGHTWAVLGDLAVREGRSDLAISSLQRAVRLSPDDAPVQIALAKEYFKAQRWADAAKTLERVRELRPTNPGSYVNLVGVYLNMGDATNAARVAEEGMRRCPDKGSVHAIAAAAYQALGRNDDAHRCQARAMQLGIEPGEED